MNGRLPNPSFDHVLRASGWGRRFTSLVALLLLAAMTLPALVLEWISELPSAKWRYSDALVAVTPTSRSGTMERLPEAKLTLPDRWLLRRPGEFGTADYRVSFFVSDGERADRALFIPRLADDGRISLNGYALQADQSIEVVPRVRWNRPLYVRMPKEHLRVGQNVLDVHLLAFSGDRAGLSEIFIGPQDAIQRTYAVRLLLQQQFVQWANFVVIALSLPVLLIWLIDYKHSSDYGLFAAGALVFALRSFHGQIDTPPIPVEMWRVLVDVSIGVAAALIGIFLLRYSGRCHATVERCVWGFIATGGIVLALLPRQFYLPVEAIVWRLPIFVWMLGCVLVFARRTLSDPSPSRYFLLAGVLAQVIPASLDMMFLLGFASFSQVMLFPITFLAVLVMMSIILAREFVQTQNDLRLLNSDLERRIDDARNELLGMYEKRRVAEHAAVSAEERGRLMRDMHDGLGTRLSLLLRSVQNGGLSKEEVLDELQSVNDEMHLIFDARGPGTTSLIDAFANLRYRLDRRLSVAGVETTWQAPDDMDDIEISPENTLHILHIIQECITNAVRHGGARRIQLGIGCVAPTGSGDERSATGRKLRVSVIDDGCGPEGATKSSRGSGRGLNNIRVRVAAISGSFSLERAAGETHAVLLLDLAKSRTEHSI